ncbi:hypothetical protein IV203_033679 [Nitzschia inconspicua]|uniref:Uncharacterized protein n=1 Tax=Nitzschia inconspicua TaxID=303405 RepID=A0A9K3K449_9STRA|nr:hypothetical protein IV203_022865 [Nitzschia inconspicua]KAG7372955.1 hypothetical protein IV203_033679 [Nitzschia inconspicua]
MSSLSVWVQLYYKGKYEPKGRPVEIEPIPKNVASLSELVKDKLKKELDHAGLTEIFVFSPESKPPFSEQISIRGDKMVKELIDEYGNKNPPLSIGYDHPLIVVAPDPKQQQPANEIAFLVGGTVIDAKQSKGARGNVFKFLENHYGHYSLTDGISGGLHRKQSDFQSILPLLRGGLCISE